MGNRNKEMSIKAAAGLSAAWWNQSAVVRKVTEEQFFDTAVNSQG